MPFSLFDTTNYLIYFIRQRNMKNFIFLWDQPIKKLNNNMNQGIFEQSGSLKCTKKQCRMQVFRV